LYLHFDSKFALLAAVTEKMRLETHEAAGRLAELLIDGDKADVRQWVEWALNWYVRNRLIAQAAQEAELSEDKPSELLQNYLECLEPWVETWPLTARTEARMRFELCRLQMHNYMWGNSHALFGDQDLAVELFTEIWWNTLKAPQLPCER